MKLMIQGLDMMLGEVNLVFITFLEDPAFEDAVDRKPRGRLL